MKNSDAKAAQATLAGVIIFLIVVVTGVAGVIQAAHSHPQARDRAERVSAERHFWLAIAGSDSTAAPSVENQLAQDLADTPADDLIYFRGDSNRYGGITDAIGFDPFNGSGLNCTECGPLSDSTRAKVKLAKDGRVDSVLALIPEVKSDPGFTLTPFGIGFAPYLVGLWFIIGHVSYLWTAPLRDEEGVDGRMIATAPLVAAWTTFKAHRAKHRDREQISSVFPDAVAQIDAADEFLRKLPADSPTVQKLRDLRDQVEAELRRQAQQSANGRDETKLAALTASLSAVSDALDSRSKALDDIANIDPSA